MGWLREFMKASQPPVASFGRLAEACLEHPAWPDDTQPKPRSLAALFSKLDHEQDLDWLRDRPEVIDVLGALLKRPVADIRAAIGEPDSVESGRYLRLRDLPFGRQLDLVEEPLPPGIPLEVQSPASWQLTWWQAGAASGRSLVGRWLQGRGLAHSHVANSPEQLVGLPARGPLYLEWTGARALDERTLRALGALRRPLCVASPVAPLANTLDVTQVASSPPLGYLSELVDWVADRVGQEGYFDPAAAEHWMRSVALPREAARNFGETLGLLGMLDEVRPPGSRGSSLDELADRFVRRRLKRALSGASSLPALERNAFEQLQELAARCLVQPGSELGAPRPLQQWVELIAGEQSSAPVDAPWLSAVLSGPLGKRVSASELARAARALPPGPFQFARALTRADLLQPVDTLDRANAGEDGNADGLRLGPSWLVRVLEARAAEQALRFSSTEWGRALLSDSGGNRIMQGLLQRLMAGDYSAIEYLLEEGDPQRLGDAAALEASLIALASAGDSDDVPEDLSQEVNAWTERFEIRLNAQRLPRVAASSPALFDRAHWLVARVLSFPSERWPNRRAAWRAIADLEKRQESLFDTERLVAAAEALHGTDNQPSDNQPSKHEASPFDDALEEDEPPDAEPCRPILLPLLAAWCEGDTNAVGALLQALGPESFARHQAHLFQRLNSKELAWSRVADVLWSALGEEPDLSIWLPEAAVRRRFWQQASPARLAKRLASNNPAPARSTAARGAAPAVDGSPAEWTPGEWTPAEWTPVEWTSLLPHQFSDYLAKSDVPPLPHAAAAHVPVDAALGALERRGFEALSPDCVQGLLHRAPGRFGPLLESWLTEDHRGMLRPLLRLVPPSVSAEIAALLPSAEQILHHSPAVIDELRSFFLRLVHERHPGVEDHYLRLAVIERKLAPLRNLTAQG